MKLIARVLLFLFLVFLSTPTIVRLIEKSCDTSLIFSFSEEEHAKKEFKVFAYSSNEIQHSFSICKFKEKAIILSENLSKHDKITTSIFSPPPDFL